MHSCRCRSSHCCTCAHGAAVLLAVTLFAAPAEAHRLNIWAAADNGRTINGRAYFAGGGKARDIAVRIIDPDGKFIAEVRTDDAGDFTYRAETRCDHTFVVDSGDGHRSTFTIRAAELSDDLAAPTDAGHTETASLRQELHEYEQKVRLRDILGGIGYIVGITGIAFYSMGRRKHKA